MRAVTMGKSEIKKLERPEYYAYGSYKNSSNMQRDYTRREITTLSCVPHLTRGLNTRQIVATTAQSVKKLNMKIKVKLQGNKKDGYSLTLTNGKYTFSENFTHEELEEIKKLLIKKI